MPPKKTGNRSCKKSKPGPSTSKVESSTSKAGPSIPNSRSSNSKGGPSTSRIDSSTSQAGPSTSNAGSSFSQAEPTTSKSEASTSKAGPSTSKSEASTSKAGPSTPRSYSSKSRHIKRIVPKHVPKCIKFMNLLQGREMGIVQPYHFSKTAYQMKLEDYNLIGSHKFTTSHKSHTTYLVRAGRNAVVAAWYLESESGFSSAVSLLPYNISKVNPSIAARVLVNTPHTVIDACQVATNPDLFVFISSDRNGHGLLTIATPKYGDSPHTVSYSNHHIYRKNFNCCNSNYFLKKFSLGLDKEVTLYDITGREEIRYFDDNIHSIAYNRKGNTLHMGCESGELILCDLRCTDVSCRIKLDENILDDVQMLSDENYCLASGPSGKLMKVDIRSTSKVFDFPSHNRRSRRIPVSLNQKFEFASCTGADNITRIWSLRNGDLLHSFEAPSSYPARSCILPRSSRGHIHLIQDDFIHVYSMLR